MYIKCVFICTGIVHVYRKILRVSDFTHVFGKQTLLFSRTLIDLGYE